MTPGRVAWRRPRRRRLRRRSAAGRERARRAAGRRPLLDEVFPDGLPFPFEAVLDRLRAAGRAGERRDRADPARPLAAALRRRPGLLRLAAGRGGGDRRPGAGPATPRLADRVFLGYQPAAEVSRRSATTRRPGGSSSQEVVGYRRPRGRREPAERRRLPRLPPGRRADLRRGRSGPRRTPTRRSRRGSRRSGRRSTARRCAQTVDGLEAFDAATDRAARIAAGEPALVRGLPRRRLPRGAAGGGAALRARRRAPGAGRAGRARLRGRGRRLLAGGLAVVSPDLPNRDPLLAGPDLGDDRRG